MPIPLPGLIPLSGPVPQSGPIPQSGTTTPGLRECATCGTQNEPARRFCQHCGDWLVTPTAKVRTPPSSVGGALKRRWRGEAGPYTASLSRSTIAFRAIAGLAGAAVLAAVLGLAGLHPIQRVSDQIAHVRGSGRVDHASVSAAANPADGLAGGSAAWAVDDVRDRGWATRWIAPTAGNPDRACTSGSGPAANSAAANTAAANTLALTFPAPINIREIGIEAGLAPADERNNRWQPRTLELRWSNGECQPVNLKNVPGLQRFGVNQGVVRGLTIVVVAGYAPASAGSDRLDLGEVTFWHR